MIDTLNGNILAVSISTMIYGWMIMMNNNVKRLLKIIGTLLPNYKFIQVSETRIEIYYRFKSIPKRTLYVGFFIISTMKVPEANSYVTFVMPKDIPFNVLKDWINIGLTCEDISEGCCHTSYKVGGYA